MVAEHVHIGGTDRGSGGGPPRSEDHPSRLRALVRPTLRRWPVVLAVTVLAVTISVVWAFGKAKTTWTATTALTTQSQNRAPDQDAVLSLGYVDYFNQPTYQQLLRGEAEVPADVSLKAETGAASPILYIEASAPTEAAARTAATNAAETFRLDIRKSLVAERTQEVKDLQAQVDAAVTELQKPGTTSAEGNVILDQIRSLQGRITDISSDATNHLKELQPQPGIAVSKPSPMLDILAGGFAGLLLGLIIAFVLAQLDDRVRGAADIRALGLAVLGELPPGSAGERRQREVERLATALTAGAGKAGLAVALVPVANGDTRTSLAAELVDAAAMRRSGSLLVRADLREPSDFPRAGLIDVLEGRCALHDVIASSPTGARIVPPGNVEGRDPYKLTDPRAVVEFMADATDAAGLAVLEVAAVDAAPESEVFCAAVDRVVLVVRSGGTRRAALRAARDLLERTSCRIAGVVIDAPVGGALGSAEADRGAAEAAPTAPVPAVLNGHRNGGNALSVTAADRPGGSGS